jgi:integrase
VEGIRRTKGVSQEQKAPTLTGNIRRMIAALPDTPIGVRDGALLLVGYAGALRRSELVMVDYPDLEFTDDGLVITLRKSKSDQDVAGQYVGVPYGSHPETCPVRLLQAWLKHAEIAEGPVFRPINRHGRILPNRLTNQSVALIVERWAGAAGLDPARYAGHSLRAGLATEATEGGAPTFSVMAHLRHKDERTALFRMNAAAYVGL